MDKNRILQAGDLVQWYRIESVLGRGGFGVTYLATDTNLDHKVAIKEYMPGWAVERQDDNSLAPLNDELREEFDLGVQSFLREARTLVKFRHPNIVRVMAVFEANNTAYLVMEYEEGEEFKSYVQRGDGIDEQSLQSLVLRIVDGLDQVHQYGFLHRDIKPVNLIIRNDGSPVLLDFGAARPTDSEAGAHTAYVSAGYTPIEQYQEGKGMRVGPWTDIYALGATLYYAISGEAPTAPTGRLAAMVSRSPDPMRSAMEVGEGRYSETFLDAIDWALVFKPDGRPRDLTEWRSALSASEPAPEPVPKPTIEDELRPQGLTRPDTVKPNRIASAPVKKSDTGVIAAVLGTLVVTVVVGGWFFHGYQQRSQLEALLSRANAEFENGALINGALPLYRQVLGSAPNNGSAQSRLNEIVEITRNRIDTSIADGDIDRAEKSLTEFQSISTDIDLLRGYEQQINNLRQRRTTDRQFDQALSLVSAGEPQEALNMLDSLRTSTPGDPRIEEITAAAQGAIDNAREQQEQQARTLAETQRKEEETRRRIAEASRRQTQRRQSYNSYLRLAESSLSEGDVASTRRWIDEARALQINDSRLSNLESQVVEQETYLRKPLSNYEVSYASGQFNALRGAVESRNTRAVDSLSLGTPSREGLFDNLFNRYTRLEAKIIDVKSELDPKRVTAKLRIEAMILPNGDIVYPSPAYRDTELTLNRQRYGWSRIVW